MGKLENPRQVPEELFLSQHERAKAPPADSQGTCQGKKNNIRKRLFESAGGALFKLVDFQRHQNALKCQQVFAQLGWVNNEILEQSLVILSSSGVSRFCF